MALTAREWLLLPLVEQKRRAEELSAHECFLLRTVLSYIHFSEEEKETMSLEDKKAFLSRGNKKPEEVKKMQQEQEKILQEFKKKYTSEKRDNEKGS